MGVSVLFKENGKTVMRSYAKLWGTGEITLLKEWTYGRLGRFFLRLGIPWLVEGLE